jgi:hypothetical protein
MFVAIRPSWRMTMRPAQACISTGRPTALAFADLLTLSKRKGVAVALERVRLGSIQ